MVEPTAKDIIKEIRETSSTIEEASEVVDKFAAPDVEEVKIRRRNRRSSTQTIQASPLPPEMQPQPIKTEVKKIDLTDSLLRGGTQQVEALGRASRQEKEKQGPISPQRLAEIEREEIRREQIARATREARQRIENQGRPQLITREEVRAAPIISGTRFRAAGQAISTVLPFLPAPAGTDGRLTADITSTPIRKTVEFAANNPFATAFAGAGTLNILGTGARILGPAATSIPGVQPTLSFLGATATRRFITGTALAGTQFVGISKGVETFGTSQLTDQQRKILESEGFRGRVGDVLQLQRQELAAEGAVQIPIGKDRSLSSGGFLFGISPSFGSEDQFRRIAKEQGFSQEEIEVAAILKSSQGTGELLAGLNLARFTEGFGRKEVTKAFASKQGKKLSGGPFIETFKTTAAPLARAGFIEGSVGELGQQVIRADERSGTRRAIDVGLFGAFGAASSTLLGGTIAGLQPKTKTGSLLVETAASIADPLEKPGDILEGVFESQVKGQARTVVSTPTLTLTGEAVQLGVQTQPGPGIKRPDPKTTSDTTTTSAVPTENVIPTFIEQPTVVPSPSKKTTKPSPVIGQPVIEPTVPIPSDVPTDIITEAPVDIPVQAPINIFTNIPVVTPQMRIPPPIPIQLPGRGGGAGRQVRLQKTFVNELQAGFSALGIGIGAARATPVVPKTKSKSKKKGKKKRKQEPFSLFGNGPTLPGGIRIL